VLKKYFNFPLVDINHMIWLFALFDKELYIYAIGGLVYLYVSLRFSSHDLFSFITINNVL
jgi:hypothetical protein